MASRLFYRSDSSLIGNPQFVFMESFHMLSFLKAEESKKEHNVSHKLYISTIPQALSSWIKKVFNPSYVFN